MKNRVLSQESRFMLEEWIAAAARGKMPGGRNGRVEVLEKPRFHASQLPSQLYYAGRQPTLRLLSEEIPVLRGAESGNKVIVYINEPGILLWPTGKAEEWTGISYFHKDRVSMAIQEMEAGLPKAVGAADLKYLTRFVIRCYLSASIRPKFGTDFLFLFKEVLPELLNYCDEVTAINNRSSIISNSNLETYHALRRYLTLPKNEQNDFCRAVDGVYKSVFSPIISSLDAIADLIE